MLETRKAYEYALDRIGLDLHSAGLWQEYINYMQLPRPNTPAYRALWASGAAPGQEDSQRIMTLRSSPALCQIALSTQTHAHAAPHAQACIRAESTWSSAKANIALLMHTCSSILILHFTSTILQSLHRIQYTKQAGHQ